MTPTSSIYSARPALFLDPGAIICLVETGFAERILKAIPLEPIIPEPAAKSLERRASEWHSGKSVRKLGELLESGAIAKAGMVGPARRRFQKIASRPSPLALGDGEASAIALAWAAKAWAAIEDGKARRLCQERCPLLKIVGVADMLAHESVIQELSSGEMAEATLNAVYRGNMRVPPNHVENIAKWIGPKKLQRCKSVPKDVRTRLLEKARARKRLPKTLQDIRQNTPASCASVVERAKALA